MSSNLPTRGAVSSWLHDPDRTIRVPAPYMDVLYAYVAGELRTATETDLFIAAAIGDTDE